MPETIPATSATDFLAAVPALTGFIPRNSLVCVPFVGACSAQPVVRVSLPARRREAEIRRMVSYVVGVVSRMGGVDGVRTVVYTDATFAAERGIPWLDLGRGLARGLQQAGFVGGEGFCVAADGWGSYSEITHQATGCALADIAESAMAKRLNDLPGLPHTDGPAAEAALPTVSDDDRAAYQAIAREVRSEIASGQAGPLIQEVASRFGGDPVDWYEHCLDSEKLDLLETAFLIEMIQAPANRDHAMLQFAFGPEVGEHVFGENARLLRRQAATKERMDDVVARELRDDPGALDTVRDLILGWSEIPPDFERVRRAIAVLRVAAAHASPDRWAAPLCMLAWLYWAIGQGSKAGEMVGAVREVEPAYGMADILRVLVDTGHTPEWIYHVAS